MTIRTQIAYAVVFCIGILLAGLIGNSQPAPSHELRELEDQRLLLRKHTSQIEDLQAVQVRLRCKVDALAQPTRKEPSSERKEQTGR